MVNETLTVGSSTTLEVTHSDLPVYVSDFIDIEATALIDGSPAGKATVAVYGGKLAVSDHRAVGRDVLHGTWLTN